MNNNENNNILVIIIYVTEHILGHFMNFPEFWNDYLVETGFILLIY